MDTNFFHGETTENFRENPNSLKMMGHNIHRCSKNCKLRQNFQLRIELFGFDMTCDISWLRIELFGFDMTCDISCEKRTSHNFEKNEKDFVIDQARKKTTLLLKPTYCRQTNSMD